MVLNIAHRGASGHAPENTFKAFDLAVEMGCEGIELDVQQCGSGELVIIHDDTADRTTNGTGNVSEMTLAELQQLDAGEGEKIPTLSEVVERYPDLPLYFDIKYGHVVTEVVSAVQTFVDMGRNPADFLLLSRDVGVLLASRESYPQIPLCVGFEQGETDDMLAVVEEVKPFGVIPHFTDLTPSLVAQIQTVGTQIFTWTVNSPEEISLCEELGVDGIITDFPDRMN